jgi:hypothetical protein
MRMKLEIFVFCTFMLFGAFLGLSANAAEPIGRLFMTPADRSNLDYIRQSTKNIPLKVDTPSEQESPKERPAIAVPDAVNMQGYVKRGDGKQGTVWVNDNAMLEGSGNKDVKVGKLPTDGNKVPVKLPNGRQILLKAGQVYDSESNRIHEARSHAAQGEETSGRIGDDASE